MQFSVISKEFIDVKMFGKVMQKNGWEHHGREALENIFVFVTDGEAEFSFFGKNYYLKKNVILIIPKGAYYTAKTNDFCEYYFLHFSANINIDLSDTSEKTLPKQSFRYKLPDINDYISFMDFYEAVPDEIEQILSECRKLSYSITYSKKILLNSKFYEIIARLGMLNEKQREKSPEILGKITEYIRREYRKNISLSDMSEKFNVSKSYIARLFKTYYETTTVKYISDYKLDHARELLVNTNMNVQQISEYLGFNESFYFSRRFKERFGVSPLNYRKEKIL